MNLEPLKYGATGALMTIASCGGAVEKKQPLNPVTVINIPAAEEEQRPQSVLAGKKENMPPDLPATIEAFHEALANCAIILSGTEAVDSMLSRIQPKTCRTWQQIYDNARQPLRACMPVVVVKDTPFVQEDFLASRNAEVLAVQMRVLNLRLQDFALEHNDCVMATEGTTIRPVWTTSFKPMF